MSGRRSGCPIVLVVVIASLIGVLGLITLGLALFAQNTGEPSVAQSRPGPPAELSLDRPLVVTYYFYWYDATTNEHLGPQAPLPTHPVASPPASWRSIAWHKKELADMAQAGIDVVLPVYWGFGKEIWSTEGLAVLIRARDEMVAAGAPAPAVGMFFDSSILKERDLTKPENMAYFYANVKDFFTRVPSRHRALINGRPIVWLWGPQSGNNVTQELFDNTYTQFERDNGVRPFIVRDLGWDCAITGWKDNRPLQNCSRPIRTDASFVWGVAQNGYDPHGEVAAVGPGYDERLVPGRSGVVRGRDGGRWYRSNFEKAIASKKKLLAIETWNEFHEASGISESVEYGRSYIELTRSLTDRYRSALGVKTG